MAILSVLGKATSGDPDSYFLTLDMDTEKWAGGERGNTGKVIKTKSGKFLYKSIPDKGTYCLSNSGEVIIFLRNLKPSDAKKGDEGKGNANETGRTVCWKIESL